MRIDTPIRRTVGTSLSLRSLALGCFALTSVMRWTCGMKVSTIEVETSSFVARYQAQGVAHIGLCM